MTVAPLPRNSEKYNCILFCGKCGFEVCLLIEKNKKAAVYQKLAAKGLVSRRHKHKHLSLKHTSCVEDGKVKTALSQFLANQKSDL